MFVRKIRYKKFRFGYLRKTLFKFYQNPDPHITNADPKHWVYQQNGHCFHSHMGRQRSSTIRSAQAAHEVTISKHCFYVGACRRENCNLQCADRMHTTKVVHGQEDEPHTGNSSSVGDIKNRTFLTDGQKTFKYSSGSYGRPIASSHIIV
jgi:hypothetical protein